MSLIGDYRPGTTPVHRISPGPKLLGLAVFGVALVVVRGVPSAIVFFAAALAVAALAQVRLATVARAARSILLLAVVLAALQGWHSGWPRAVETFLDLLSVTIAGVILTATTSVNAMIDSLTKVVRSERVALTIGLAIRSIPETIGLLTETRDAARARGLRHPRAYLAPFVVRVVARAHETGAALHARGIAD